jgi:hypothetical protein
VSAHPHGGSTRAVRLFVTVCFTIWAALSYMALFALATVFWVAYLESRFHPGAFAKYGATLVGVIASAIASLWLWKRVHDHPWLYVPAAWLFGVAIVVAAIVAAVVLI